MRSPQPDTSTGSSKWLYILVVAPCAGWIPDSINHFRDSKYISHKSVITFFFFERPITQHVMRLDCATFCAAGVWDAASRGTERRTRRLILWPLTRREHNPPRGNHWQTSVRTGEGWQGNHRRSNHTSWGDDITRCRCPLPMSLVTTTLRRVQGRVSVCLLVWVCEIKQET